MNKKIVVYTALFGNYSGIIEQPKLENVDYICYTDQDITSNSWKIIKVTPPIKGDNTRSNRYYKILPHKHLKGYDVSVYIDANFLILKDFTSMALKRLQNNSMLCFDHNQTALDKRNCIYLEHETLEKIAKNFGIYRDSIETMQLQINFLKTENYPKDNGLISAGVLIRNHFDKDVIILMELWWNFVKNRSKRDQLSFNYAVWKLNFDNLEYLKGDIRSGNPWFHWFDHKLDFNEDLKFKKKEIFMKKYFPLILKFMSSKIKKRIVFTMNYPYRRMKFNTWCKRYSKGILTTEERLYILKKTNTYYLSKKEIILEITKIVNISSKQLN